MKARILVGIDEVGRGCWAGPLVAAAVVLKAPIVGLTDSKKLSKQQRERLAILIHQTALAVGIGWVDPATIDEVGLTRAVTLAMERAVAQIDIPFHKIIIDGSYNFLAHSNLSPSLAISTLVKADNLIPAVSAASIVAKVARDKYMTDLAQQYPAYGFEHHVGYGTALHSAKLKQHGVTSEHRHSYKPIQALLT